jgi:hypothetical protein
MHPLGVSLFKTESDSDREGGEASDSEQSFLHDLPSRTCSRFSSFGHTIASSEMNDVEHSQCCCDCDAEDEIEETDYEDAQSASVNHIDSALETQSPRGQTSSRTPMRNLPLELRLKLRLELQRCR